VSGKANGVIQVASGLPGLAWGYPSYLDALSAKINQSPGGRPMRKFRVSLVEGYLAGYGDWVRSGKQSGAAKCYPAG
jgi:hypothetical protein